MSVEVDDTIFAVATPPGRSAIAVIRVSGAEAASAPALFSVPCPVAGQFGIARLMQEGKVLDQVIILFMKAPYSSTGENVCEIHCHGSLAVIDAIIDLLGTKDGFRVAGPGEFTKRSFMNGKMDLLGVEGLADLIDAETPAQLHQAWAQIDGALRAPVMSWRAELITIAARLEALIDFSDEDLPLEIENSLRSSTKALASALLKNLNDGGVGELVRDGVVMALVGPVNAGKSTILNALAGRDAAIVSNEAGTTRDIVQIQLDFHGVPVTIRDTAGIRDASGEIESEGIKRSIMAAASADLVLIILDGSDKGWQDARDKINKSIERQVTDSGMIKGQIFYVLNKADCGIFEDASIELDSMLVMSAQSPADICKLVKALEKCLVPLNHTEGSVIITRQRHRKAMQIAYDALTRAVTHNFQREPELAAEEFRAATGALGRITGEIDVEELLESIFSAFCIGK
ncbi:tRNA uridine-5-carboxymethylaminomethyl(34) synthesis GTPase MnmE [Candidatus Puniceispirillum sp.]|nr:tRNA uridine-5-carboxymethylaminomethyl(34) synthesis GTPase MnmE [Candidatus Puniceispirillum sp.]